MSESYPVLALRNTNIFPENVVPLRVGRARSVNLILEASENAQYEGEIVLIAQRDSNVDNPSASDLYEVGTVAKILKIVRVKDEGQDHLSIIVKGVKRVKLVSLDQSGEFDVGEFEDFPIESDGTDEEKALEDVLRSLAASLTEEVANTPKEMKSVLAMTTRTSDVCYFIAGNLDLTVEERQEILTQPTLRNLITKVTESVNKLIQSTKTAEELQQNIASEAEKTHKEWYLRQQLKAIKKELGEGEDAIEALADQVDSLDLPDEVRQVCHKQIDRLRGMQSASSEYSVTLNYVETLLEIPWNVASEDNINLDDAQETLDNDHHGLDKVKDRIIEYLAVRKLKDDMKGPILCLAGPPGVGKTSLGASIARALGREFIRISLGGVHDESEIRGHRRTYVGAMPGRLTKALIKAGTNNPVILLDEIDKIGKDFRGDPQAAMLEVLDPEQNNTFTDHYVEIPLDLSNVLFLATANQLETISGPLRDRMEIIEVPSYTLNEKFEIAQKHLYPKQLTKHGITQENMRLEDEALSLVIDSYTREAGVRNLERRIADLCRGVAVQVAKVAEEDRDTVQVVCNTDFVTDKLGPERYTSEVAQRTSVSGVSTGLAWTSVGGDILFVECAKYPGSGKLKLTGQLGDVMKESAQAAITYLRSNAGKYNMSKEVFEEQDLHIHFPAGAIPKDGPSAGVTIFSAVLSCLTDVNVSKEVAMTGEITLRGSVLPVGGIKEKLTAAHRAGIKRVLIPKECVKYLRDLPDEVRNDLEIFPVSRVEEIPELVLEKVVPTVPIIEGDDDGSSPVMN